MGNFGSLLFLGPVTFTASLSHKFLGVPTDLPVAYLEQAQCEKMSGR
jgi:hypothetical protein